MEVLINPYASSSLSSLYSFSDSNEEILQHRIDLYNKTPQSIPKLESTIPFIQQALTKEKLPVLIDDCTGGTYMLFNEYDSVEAIFKPCDEEPFCVNNPKGILPDQFQQNDRDITPGSSCYREVAAYFLDHHHFAGVPETSLASISITQDTEYDILYKEGSIQLYVEHECSSEDYGPSMFSLPNIQAIALLDIRLLNLDRHENNLLVFSSFSHSSLHLIPIDHGYCLPRKTTKAIPQWCWLNWNHSKLPLCSEMKEYLLSLDIERDIRLLHSYLSSLEESALDTLRITTLWLQVCASMNLSLFDIGSFFLPQQACKESQFQILVSLYQSQIEKTSFVDFLYSTGREFMLRILSTVCSSIH